MRVWKKPSVQLALLVILLLMNELIFASRFGRELCMEDGYRCIRIRRNQSWRSLFPDPAKRDIVMRVNRMNTQLYPGMVIAVPDNLADGNILDFAPFPRLIDPPNEKLVKVDPFLQAWGAYDSHGVLVRWGPASSGTAYCRDIDQECYTPAGSFRVFSLGSSDCYSTKFPVPNGGAPMPYCMYFHNGQALHGEPNGLPGHNASHGCVRLYVNDAYWLRYDFIEGPTATNKWRGTRVDVGEY